MKYFPLTISLFGVLALAACSAEPEVVVREGDDAKRLAEYEQVVDASGEQQPNALPREVIGDEPDVTREKQTGGEVDRFERPTNTPYTDVTKDSQVGATVCPEPDRATIMALAEAGVDYDDWLLDMSASGTSMTAANGLSYKIVQGGIERGYEPQAFNEVTLAFGSGEEVRMDPKDMGKLGEVVMAMTPCQIVQVDAGDLDAETLDALETDDRIISLQLLKVDVI